MDLHSGHPWWFLTNGLIETYPPLREKTTCEVLVVGGGVSGALAAVRLVEAGLDVVLVDRREFGLGSTCASTALLMYELDSHLVNLRATWGTSKADMAYKACHDILDEVPRWAEKAGGLEYCGYREKKSIYLASEEKDVQGLREECEARQGLEFECRLLESPEISDLFSFAAPAALLTEKAAELDAYRFSHGLLRYSAKRGLRAYDRTVVEKVIHNESNVTCITETGAEISAQHIVFAAGYETQKYLPRKYARFFSTYAFVSEPVESFDGWWNEALIWETSRPYIYLRTTPDKRIIMGGGDERFTTAQARDRRLTKKVKELALKFGEMFPLISMEPAFSWAGTFAESPDGLPRIGTPGDWDRAHYIMGYGGNGMTFSMLAAEIVTGEITGDLPAYAQAFSFNQ